MNFEILPCKIDWSVLGLKSEQAQHCVDGRANGSPLQGLLRIGGRLTESPLRFSPNEMHEIVVRSLSCRVAENLSFPLRLKGEVTRFIREG